MYKTGPIAEPCWLILNGTERHFRHIRSNVCELGRTPQPTHKCNQVTLGASTALLCTLFNYFEKLSAAASSTHIERFFGLNMYLTP